MAKIGFARVSTNKQELTEQITQLKNAGCEKIFQGKNSGKKESNAERLAELLAYIREGDVVVVTKLDRLGRSTSQIVTILDELLEQNIDIQALDGSVDTTRRNDPFAMALARFISVFAELERSLIITRTKEGKLAKGKAGIGGRPSKINQFEQFRKDVDSGKTLGSLAQKYNVSISTVSRQRKKILNKEMKQEY